METNHYTTGMTITDTVCVQYEIIKIPIKYQYNPLSHQRIIRIPSVFLMNSDSLPNHVFFTSVLTVKQMVATMALHHWFNHAKATRDLGYRPRVTLEDGIKRTVQWLQWNHRRRRETPGLPPSQSTESLRSYHSFGSNIPDHSPHNMHNGNYYPVQNQEAPGAWRGNGNGHVNGNGNGNHSNQQTWYSHDSNVSNGSAGMKQTMHRNGVNSHNGVHRNGTHHIEQEMQMQQRLVMNGEEIVPAPLD